MRKSTVQYETRFAISEDESFLYDCYKQSMREYVEQTWGWNEEFQRTSFLEHLPWHRFEIMTIGSGAVGGACVQDSSAEWKLEMLIISPPFQHMGIGSDFVMKLARRSRQARRPLRLHVLKVNPARRLYERLGFAVIREDAGTYEMELGA